MAMQTQGSDLYTIDPEGGELIEVGCVTSIDGLDTAIEQIETTCLSSRARTYLAGLATPGTATFNINADPRDASHIRLHQLKVAGADLQWALGWSDNTGLPPAVTIDSNGDYVFDAPSERSWLLFEGFMNSFPFSFEQNSVVQSSVGIQVSGDPLWVPASSGT